MLIVVASVLISRIPIGETAALWPWRAVWACKPNLSLQILNITTVSKKFFLGCVIGDFPSLTGRATQAKLYRWIERKSLGGDVIATVVTSTKGDIIKPLTGVQQCTALHVTPGLCCACAMACACRASIRLKRPTNR